MDEETLIRESLENPELDEPRLVYADWLEDRGDPRGDFLRIQCEFNKFDFDHAAVAELRSDLAERWSSLASDHQDWLDLLATKYHVWYLSGNFGKLQLVKMIRMLTGFGLADAVKQASGGIPRRVLANLDFPKAEAVCQMASRTSWSFEKSKLIAVLPTWREPPELKRNSGERSENESTTKNDPTVPKS